MPSFATEVKNELVRASTRKTCCQNAELAALLRMGASMTIGPAMNLGLNFVTENAAVARRVLQLLKANGQVKPEVTVSRAKRLKKNNSYFLRVAPSPQVRPLMESLGMLGDNEGSVGHDKGLLRRQCCRKAYLRGAFLGGGTVNRPEAKAHLEFVANSYPFANTLMQVLKKMDFPVGITDRKNNYQVYMKDGEEIMDLLAMLGAPKAVEQLEVARNLREVRNQVNRLVTVKPLIYSVQSVPRWLRCRLFISWKAGASWTSCLLKWQKWLALDWLNQMLPYQSWEKCWASVEGRLPIDCAK